MASTPSPTRPEPSTPRHVAIIMDGNGRWASANGRPRAWGHREGVNAVRRVVRAAGDAGVRELTLFGFSTENWRRPPDEVHTLFDLLRAYVAADLKKLHAEGVRVRVIGRRDDLAPDLVDIINRAEATTTGNDRFHLTIAFNYGGRDDIVRAAQVLAAEAAAGKRDASAIDERALTDALDTQGRPDPDLIIRTSGERRLSNFLIWQGAYAELVFLDVMWPDFDAHHLGDALAQYASRQRRFGHAPEQAARGEVDVDASARPAPTAHAR